MIANVLTKLPAGTAPNVPHEFIGQARLFCARIDAAAKLASATVLQICADARAVVQRRPTWRAEHFAGFERQWHQTIPDEGRIRLQIARSKRALTITEFRLTRSSYEDIRWSHPFPEDSVGLMLCTFRLSGRPQPSNVSGLQSRSSESSAIARRYQRGFDNTDRAIQTDISELTMNVCRLQDADGQSFAIQCPSGQWAGSIETVSLSGAPDQRLLNVRSFLHHHPQINFS